MSEASPQSDRSRLGVIGAAVLLVSLGLLVAGIAGMVVNLKEFNDDDRLRWATRRIYDESFQFRGDEVRITTQGVGNTRRVVAEWRGRTAELPITGDEDARLEQLLAHQRWLAVLQMVQVRGGETPSAAATMPDREQKLVIVGEAPPPPEAVVTSRRDKALKSVFTLVSLEEPAEMVTMTAAFSDLEIGSWSHAAALELTPSIPELADDGFSELGWTWAAANVGGLGVMVGALILLAAFTRRQAARRTGELTATDERPIKA